MILIKKFKFVMILQKFLNLNDTFLPKKLSKTRKIQLNFHPKKTQAQSAKFSSSKAKIHKLTLQSLRF